MPQILVVADDSAGSESVVYRERISTSDLESDHFSGQLVERVGWAVRDANLIEHRDPRVARRRISPAPTLAAQA